jgi:hypothetical protein
MSEYQHNSVCFNFPETWEVVEDDGDNTLRVITIEDPSDGYYSMDIYNPEQAPTLEKHVERAMQHTIKELPFYCRIFGKPIQGIEKAIHQSTEIEGVQVKFSVKAFFLFEKEYVNRYFRLNSGSKISLFSSQCAIENAAESKAGLSEILTSFSMA